MSRWWSPPTWLLPSALLALTWVLASRLSAGTWLATLRYGFSAASDLDWPHVEVV
jgi:hypothetical protein